MKIHCVTNLDLLREQWPTDLSSVPQVGHKIESLTKRGNFRLCLEVVDVTWKANNDFPTIELHVPRHMFNTLREFFEWYASHVGKSTSYFI